MQFSSHPAQNSEAFVALQFWLEHPQAPRWNFQCSDQLDEAGLQEVHDFAARIATHEPCNHNVLPTWMSEFVAHCAQKVPFYRGRLNALPVRNARQVLAGDNWLEWDQIGFCSRADLAREVWHFVPDDLSMRDLNVYWTSGTTGSEVMIPAAPQWASFYLPLYERAMNWAGVAWPHDENRVAFATIAAQEHTLTYANSSSYRNGVALKVNLHPSQWRAPDDCAMFLEAANPQVLAGDPISLQVLADGDFDLSPLAIFSSALQLTPRVRAILQARFSCPIIDFYSSHESGPLACCHDGHNWQMLNPDSFVEIISAEGARCQNGERGEIVITSRGNQFLPLLRYRSGDNASWHPTAKGIVLRDLEGRAPVVFRVPDRTINSLDVTHALRDLALGEFSLHQNSDESLRFQFRGGAEESEIHAALQKLFGNQNLQIERMDNWPRDHRKLVRYSSDLS